MKLQSIATLLSIAHSLSATTGVLANEESIKNVRGERKLQGGGNPACSASDFEGVWAYISQGTGNSFSTMITCPPFLNGDCQIMDQGLNTQDCAIIGTIKTTDMEKDPVSGECFFNPIRMGLVNSNDFKQCPTLVSAQREGDYLLFRWGDKPNPDLEDPVYYNADEPRHGIRINK